MGFSYDVLPNRTSGFYTHYPAKQGKVYFQIKTNVKNNNKQLLPCDEIFNATLDYNGGYQYIGSVVPENEDGKGFSYANIESIDPLQTRGIRILFDLPQEIETSSGAMDLKIVVNGQTYKYKYR